MPRIADAPGSTWPRGQPLRLEGVHAHRGGAEVLRGLTLTFEPARRYVVAGPSGSGKTTLLRLLNRLDDPTGGRIHLGPSPLTALPVRAVRTGIGLVFQNPRPLPGSVAENLAYPASVRGSRPPDRPSLAAALEEVGLDPGWLDRDASALSGGERQRLALAVALQAGPEILALDEPTSGLDPAAARRVASCLKRRSEQDGLRTIVVTHHREHALWLGETTVLLDAGRLADLGPTAEVLARADAAAWADLSPGEVGP